MKFDVTNISTPAYVFDIDILKNILTEIKETLGEKYNICYAMKANPFVLEEASKVVDRLEVCSPGEYEICNLKKVPFEKIIISGVNKTSESMERIFSLSGGKGIFTIESEKHYEVLSSLAEKNNCKLDVLIRLTSGNQFGVSEETFEKIAAKIKEDEHLNLVGLHYYSGTQKKLKKVEKEIIKLSEFHKHIEETLDISLEELEYGPSLLTGYFENEEVPDRSSQLSELKSILDTNLAGFKKVTLEMGRFIASECGYYLTKVNDIKCNGGYNYCIVDGGIHQLNYYGQVMGMKKPFMEVVSSGKGEDKYNICGSLCTANDVILKDVSLPVLDIDDIIVFEKCGAYSVTEGMALFLSRELPNIYFYKDNELKLVREKYDTYQLNKGGL